MFVCIKVETNLVSLEMSFQMSRPEFGSRKMSNGSTLSATSQQHPVLHSLMAIKNSPYRKGFSTFDDSDGNNADNDSVNSVMSSGLQGELFR